MDLVARLLKRGACVYVGGGPAMAKDVKAAFDDSLAQDGDARADRKTKMELGVLRHSILPI